MDTDTYLMLIFCVLYGTIRLQSGAGTRRKLRRQLRNCSGCVRGGIRLEKNHVCPWCGSELIKGEIRTNGITLDFVPEGVDILPLTGKARERAGIVALPPAPWLSSGQVSVAYHCKACRKVVIPY